MKKVMGLVIGLLPVSVSAQCITPPDCASIGYTETSCEGDSLKCPFDTTKLYCPPCDSSYKYTCSGDNIKNPIGDTCNDKYAACECITGATFTNGNCVCDTSCDTIGNIYYSDGTCSSCNILDKTPVGIVAYKDSNKRVLMSPEPIDIAWSSDQLDENGNVVISALTNISELFTYSQTDVFNQYDGKENTQIIVNFFGENAENVAAVYCYNYAPAGWESSKGQWYLPAMGELNDYIYKNQNLINNGLLSLGRATLTPSYHWSSSEALNWSAYFIVFRSGVTTQALGKKSIHAVDCIYRENLNS